MAQPGITVRHTKSCQTHVDRQCDCAPTFQAWVFDQRADRKVYKTHRTAGAAKTWRQDMLVAIRRGEVAAAKTTLTVEDAVNAWLDGARRGTVRTRGRKPFAGGTIRSVESGWTSSTVTASTRAPSRRRSFRSAWRTAGRRPGERS